MAITERPSPSTNVGGSPEETLFSPPAAASFPQREALGTAPKAFPAGEGGPQGRKRAFPSECDQPPEEGKPSPYLLLSALAVGVAFRLGFANNSPLAAWDGYYGMFWLIAMLAVTPYVWRRAVKSRTAVLLGAAAVVLCVLQMVYGFSDETLGGLRLPGIAAAMLLYLVFAAYDIPVRREGEAARRALSSVFVYPFAGVPLFFRAIVSLFRGRGRVHGRWKRALIGLLIGLPLAAGVLALLMRADANMEALFGDLFRFNWDTLLALRNTVLLVLLAAMLFYGVFERAARNDAPALPASKAASWPASTMVALLIPTLAVYAVFVVIQSGYLFGGALPVTLTYSTYARQGFTELNAVAAINFTLFALTQRYAKPHTLLTLLSALLLAATGGIVASCIGRLLLYIGAYGLTIRRVLPMWFAIFLALLTLLCAVRLYKRTFPALRVGGLVFVYWYVLLNVPDWMAIIASYNAAHGMG